MWMHRCSASLGITTYTMILSKKKKTIRRCESHTALAATAAAAACSVSPGHQWTIHLNVFHSNLHTTDEDGLCFVCRSYEKSGPFDAHHLLLRERTRWNHLSQDEFSGPLVTGRSGSGFPSVLVTTSWHAADADSMVSSSSSSSWRDWSSWSRRAMAAERRCLPT